MRVACVLVTHPRAKVEMQRQPHLKDRAALVVDRSKGRPFVVDHFPAANGVVPGMTLEQALSRNADSPVLEADEAAYRRTFHRVLLSLQEVSDRVEDAGLGTAYVRLDGLEALYRGEDQLVAALLEAVPRDLKPRAGVGDAKFPRLHRGADQPCPGNNPRPTGCGRFPRALPGGPAPSPRRGRDGDAPLWSAHPGGRGGHEAGSPSSTASDMRAPGPGSCPWGGTTPCWFP